jgi:hypothetical protein
VGYITHHGDYPTQSNRTAAWPQCLHPALREAMTPITNRECWLKDKNLQFPLSLFF